MRQTDRLAVGRSRVCSSPFLWHLWHVWLQEQCWTVGTGQDTCLQHSHWGGAGGDVEVTDFCFHNISVGLFCFTSDLWTAYVTPDMEYNGENTLQILSELSAAQFGLFALCCIDRDRCSKSTLKVRPGCVWWFSSHWLAVIKPELGSLCCFLDLMRRLNKKGKWGFYNVRNYPWWGQSLCHESSLRAHLSPVNSLSTDVFIFRNVLMPAEQIPLINNWFPLKRSGFGAA